MNRYVLLITTLTLFTGLLNLASYIQPVTATAQVDILTHSGWISSTGSYHVSGEVQNVGDSAVHYVKIIATFYDSSSTVVATDFTYTELDVILAGRKSPFEVLFIEEAQVSKIHHYALAVTFSVTSPLPVCLQLLSNSSYIGGTGSMHVVGEIKNIGTITATYVKIIATFYDSEGKVVATDFTYADPHDIEPNQVAPFDVLLIHKNRVPLVESYALTAESNQYAVIPEFPSLIILPLFMIATLLAAIAYGRKPKIKPLTLGESTSNSNVSSKILLVPSFRLRKKSLNGLCMHACFWKKK